MGEMGERKRKGEGEKEGKGLSEREKEGEEDNAFPREHKSALKTWLFSKLSDCAVSVCIRVTLECAA